MIKKTRIVVLDGFTLNPGDISWKEIEAMGDLTVYDRTEPFQIIQRIADADAVYTNKTPLDRKTIMEASSLQFIGVLATGYDVVDTQAAHERGVTVCNVPTYGTAAVAQFTIALMLEVCHHIGHHSQSVHDGRWSNSRDFCYWDYPLVELDRKTLGIIGFGRIGRSVAFIAKAFGMRVVAYDPTAGVHKSAEAEFVSLDELYQNADVISLHCPSTPDTQGMINQSSIEKMKHGVILINASRGMLIVEEDLKKALVEGKIAGAAVDVVSTEPIKADNPLLSAPNCIITPHIAWASRESRQRLMHIAAQNLSEYLKGEPINRV